VQESSTAAVAAITVFCGATLTLAFALAPIVAAVTDPLDPRRFRVFALAPDPLAGALALAGLFSVPVLGLVALAVCAAVVWVAAGATVIAAIMATIIGVATCVLFARCALGVAGLIFGDRRSRELSGLLLVTVLVIVVPVGVFLASLDWRGTVPGPLQQVVDVLSFTPIGAAWAFPLLFTRGDASGFLALIVALATVVALGFAWLALVRHFLSSIEKPLTTRERGGLGWFSVVPGTPGGAVAARSLVYWLRDRRYLVNTLVIPVAAVATVVPLLIAGVPANVAALVPILFVALFFGWLPHNDLAYDSTAIWMHVASGLRGLPDRVGRLVPILVIAIPVLAIGIPVSVALHGRWAIAPAIVGVCVSLFFSGLGLSSIASAASPYPVTPPGESPFQQPQRTGSSGAVSQALVMLGALAVSAPSLWWTWLALTRTIEAAALALWVGVATGLGVLVLGVAIGAAVFTRRTGRIMEFAEAS
jgi:ABC-2 type transport system permease protein